MKLFKGFYEMCDLLVFDCYKVIVYNMYIVIFY